MQLFNWADYNNEIIATLSSEHNPHTTNKVYYESPHRKQWKRQWYAKNRERILRNAKAKNMAK